MSLDESLQSKEINFFVGKGGVGKTTLAVSSALSIAEKLKKGRVLAISTDPAHSLADTLDLPYTSKSGIQTFSDLPLDVVQIEPRNEKQYSGVYGILNFFQFAHKRGVPIDLDSISCMLTIATYATTLWTNGYKKLIIDSEPTAGLFRLLQLPETIDKNLARMIRNPILAQAFELLGALSKDMGQFTSKQFRKDARSASELLKKYRDTLYNQDSTGFIIVSSPEHTVLSETQRLIKQLQEYGFSIDGILFNKLFDKNYDMGRIRKSQYEKVRKFAEGHREIPIVAVPYISNELIDRKVLSQLGNSLLVKP